MLQAHGLVMNGGVLHAIELLDGDDLAEALDGYRYYEFEKMASLLIRAKQLFEADEKLDQYESELDREYELVVPSDSSLFEQFRNHLLSNPAAYAALCTKDES